MITYPEKRKENLDKQLIVYIGHEIGALNPKDEADGFIQVRLNLVEIGKIVREINLNPLFKNVVPCAPYYCDCMSMNDNNPEERERGIQNDIALIKTGVYQEFWVCSTRMSKGVEAEILLFNSLGIPVIPVSAEMIKYFNENNMHFD